MGGVDTASKDPNTENKLGSLGLERSIETLRAEVCGFLTKHHFPSPPLAQTSFSSCSCSHTLEQDRKSRVREPNQPVHAPDVPSKYSP